MKILKAALICSFACLVAVDAFSFRRLTHNVGNFIKREPAKISRNVGSVIRKQPVKIVSNAGTYLHKESGDITHKVGDVGKEAVKVGKLAQPVGDYVGKESVEAAHDVANQAKQVGKLLESEVVGAIDAIKDGGDCAGSGCCAVINLGKLDRHLKACLNVTYNRELNVFDILLTADGKTIINDKGQVGASLCKAVKSSPVSLCVAILDVRVSSHVLSGNAQLQARVLGLKVVNIELGKFKIPLE